MTKEEKQKLLAQEFNGIYQLLVDMADSLPKTCNCDGEYYNGNLHGIECSSHKAERFLTELGL